SAICHSPSAVCHLPFAICHSSSVFRLLLPVLCLLSAPTIFAQPLDSSSAAIPGRSAPVAMGPHSRTYHLGGAPTVELTTGMNYWDGKNWSRSDPTFTETQNAFVAARVQHKIRLNADLNAAGAVGITTPDGLSLSSTPVAIGFYDPVTGEFAL